MILAIVSNTKTHLPYTTEKLNFSKKETMRPKTKQNIPSACISLILDMTLEGKDLDL